MKIRPTASSIARHRFPIDEWRLVETEPSSDDLGLTETLFAVGNGYLGMRDNPPEDATRTPTGPSSTAFTKPGRFITPSRRSRSQKRARRS